MRKFPLLPFATHSLAHMATNRHSIKAWFLTYPQCADSKEQLMDKLRPLSIEAIVCEEKHEDGSPHLHAFCRLIDPVTKRQSLETFNLCSNTGNYQPARSWKAVQEYIKKDGNYITHNIDVESASQKKAKRSRSILEDDIDTLIDNGVISATQIDQVKRCRTAYHYLKNDDYDHDDVRGLWYYGAPGTGKSRKAREENPTAYIKAQNKWFDGYTGEDVIILDDFDQNGKCLGHYLKIWADRYRCSGEVKGGQIKLRHKKFIITSNYSIDEIFNDDIVLCDAIKRRFHVTHFDSL